MAELPQKHRVSVSGVLKILGVSRSGYRAWKQRVPSVSEKHRDHIKDPKRISKSVSQICDARIMEHSRKPEEIRDRIVELCGDLPRIELFARSRAEGWDSLGNEIDGKDIREAICECNTA